MSSTFFVPGVPVTQGSSRAFAIERPGKRPTAVITPDNKVGLRSWRFLVASAAREAGCRPLAGAVGLSLEFRLPAPKGRPPVLRTSKQTEKWAYPFRKPDVDRLARAVLDALTGVAFSDDAQVVDLSLRKRYAGPDGAGLLIEISEVTA